MLVAYNDEIPVGFSATRGNPLEALFVLPTRWKSGTGRKLMLHLSAEHEELNLAVYQKNQRAIAFYQRMDYLHMSNYQTVPLSDIACLSSFLLSRTAKLLFPQNNFTRNCDERLYKNFA